MELGDGYYSMDFGHILRCRKINSNGLILNSDSNNSNVVNMAPTLEANRTGDCLKYCGYDAEMIDMLGKFTKYSVKIVNPQQVNNMTISLKPTILFYGTENMTQHYIISPTLSYFHIITFMSGKIRKSNKAASLKFIESYTSDVWALIVASIILLYWVLFLYLQETTKKWFISIHLYHIQH